MAEQWELLQEMQVLEYELKELREARESTQTGSLRELWDKVRQLSQEVRLGSEKQAMLHKQGRSLEMDLAAAEDQRKMLEQRLYDKGCTSLREMEQIRAKVEATGAEYQRMENKMLDFMQQQEDNDCRLTGLTRELEEAREQHRRLQADIAKQLERLDREINSREQRRSDLLKSVDVRLQREFNQIRYKMAQPIVCMENGACSFCKMQGAASRLAGTSMLRCDHCGRLLIPESK